MALLRALASPKLRSRAARQPPRPGGEFGDAGDRGHGYIRERSHSARCRGDSGQEEHDGHPEAQYLAVVSNLRRVLPCCRRLIRHRTGRAQPGPPIGREGQEGGPPMYLAKVQGQ